MADKTGIVEILIKAHDAATAEITKVEKSLKSLGGIADGLKKVGTTLSLIGGAGITAGGLLSKTFMDFEKSLMSAAAIAGSTKEEIKLLSEAALNIGKNTTVSAKKAADAMWYLASAGWKTKQIMDSLNAVVDLSGGMFVDAAQAANLLTSTISQYGLSAKDTARVADVLAKANMESQVSINLMIDSLKYVGPVAQTVNKSLEETVAALMVLYNAGIKGEQAGTALRNIFVRLTNVTPEARKELRKFGLTAESIDPRKFKLDEIVDKLIAARVPLETLTKLLRVETAAAITAFMNVGGSAIRNFEQQLQGAVGAARELRETIENTDWGLTQTALNKLNSAFIELGARAAPAILSLTQKLGVLAEKFASLDEKSKGFLSKSAVYGGIFALITGGATFAMSSIIKLTGWIVKLGAGLKGLIAAKVAADVLKSLAAGLGKFGLIGGIIGLGAYDAIKGFELIKAGYDYLRIKLEKPVTVGIDISDAEKQIKVLKALGAHSPKAVSQLKELAHALMETSGAQTIPQALQRIISGSISEKTKKKLAEALKIDTSELDKELAKLRSAPQRYIEEGNRMLKNKLQETQDILSTTKLTTPPIDTSESEKSLEILKEGLLSQLSNFEVILKALNVDTSLINEFKNITDQLTLANAKAKLKNELENIVEVFNEAGMKIPKVIQKIAEKANLDLVVESVKKTREAMKKELTLFKEEAEKITLIQGKIASVDSLRIPSPRRKRITIDFDMRLNPSEFIKQWQRLGFKLQNDVAQQLLYSGGI